MKCNIELGLTLLQYHGGSGMTPHDHARISEVLLNEYGDTHFEVPSSCTGFWGFVDWVKYMGVGHGD
jgi:hypothetical protein